MAQIHKVEIDLSSMYKHFYKHFSWRSASDILKNILKSINELVLHKLVLLVNINQSYVAIEGIDELTKRVIEANADNVVDEIEKLAEEIARETGKDVILIELFNGYELAYAIILK